MALFRQGPCYFLQLIIVVILSFSLSAFFSYVKVTGLVVLLRQALSNLA